MTAVEWLVKELNLEGYDYTISQAKQMEKEQIIDAYYQIGKDNIDMVFPIEKDGEEYYNETYGSKGSANPLTSKPVDCHNSLNMSDKSSQIEISDDDIEKLAEEHITKHHLNHSYNTSIFSFKEGYKKAKDIVNKISDEEIENEAERYEKVDGVYSFKEAIKWYREQLKKK